MTEPLLLSSFFGLSLLLLAWLRQLALWQRKEYRLDRLWSALTSPELLSQTSVALSIFYISVALAWLLYLLRISLPISATLLGWIALFALAVHISADILRRGFVRPHPTSKLKLLVFISSVFIIVYILVAFESELFLALQWATAIYLLPLFVGLAILITNIPARLRQRQIINQAAKLRQQLKKIQVLGITGSFGKTSTKHFLEQIMHSHQKGVVATKAHRNSEFTVALDMLEQLKPRTNLYIAEMGAYRRGEIAALAQLTQPNFGLITAIANQHAALFGSPEAIANTKWELIKALPKSGTAILNADDPILSERGAKSHCPVIWYSTQKAADIRFSNVTYDTDRTAFTLRIKGQQRKITTPIISAGLTQSLAAAAAAAHALGVDLDTIAHALRALEPFPHTMELKTGPNDSTILDDSYSASQGSVINALEHLQRFPQSDKRIALVPIIELGSLGPQVHHQLGRLLGTIKAQVYIYGHAYKGNIKQGLEKSPNRCTITWHRHPTRFTESLTQNVTKDTVILLEGRLPTMVHRALNP